MAETSTGQGRFADIHSGRQAFRRYVLETWLPGHMMEASTRQGYTQAVERYLVPEFGRMRMNEIQPMHIRDFIRRLTENGASPHTVQRCKTVLSAIFTTALSDRVVYLHPCVGVRAPIVPKLPIKVITPQELDAILAAIDEPRWRLLVETAIETGLRWGELVELRVGDVDVDSGVVTVARSVLELRPQFHPTGGRFLVKMYPKDREFRWVVIRRVLVDRITEFIRGEGLGFGDLLFSIPVEWRQPTPPCSGLSEAGELTMANSAGRRYRHGTLYGYSMGKCRCTHCRSAYATYRARRRAEGKDGGPGRGIDTDGHVPRKWFLQKIWKPALATGGHHPAGTDPRPTPRPRFLAARRRRRRPGRTGTAGALQPACHRAVPAHADPQRPERALRAFTRIRDGHSTTTCRPAIRVVRAPAHRTRVLRRRTQWT